MENTRIHKGDRVEYTRKSKLGTAACDQYESGDRGFAVYVKWDGAKSGVCNPVNTKNLRKI